jgi:putative redox protein
MGETSTVVQWVGGQKYLGIDSTKHSIIMSSAAEGIGVKPSETLLLALAACTAHDVVEILAKKRTPLTSLEIITSAEQDPTPPWPFRKIHLKYRVSGRGLTDKAVEQAILLSEEKYCSVAATIRGVAEITTEYEILTEGDQQ